MLAKHVVFVIMWNPRHQMPEPPLLTHFAIVPQADKLTVGDMGGQRELIYQPIIMTLLSESVMHCLIFPREREMCAADILYCQVPAKRLAGLMGGPELANGTGQHGERVVMNGNLIRKEWGWTDVQ